MPNRHTKQPDGKFHIDGKTFDSLIGSRAQVYHGTVYKTSGGLTKKDLFQNKRGRIVSALKHATAKKENRLKKHGYTAKKGKFGAVKISDARHTSSPTKTLKRKSAKRTKSVGGKKH